MAERKGLFSRIFSSNKVQNPNDKEKIEEKIVAKDDPVTNLATSVLTLLKSTDVNTEEESKLIQLYRQMENDAIISAALDLYADSATQVNTKTKHVVAIESPNKMFEQEINEFLWKHIKIDTEAWQIVRDVARDGKVLLDTMVEADDWAFVPVDDPSTVKVLTSGQDNIKYFAISEAKKENEESFFTLYSQDKTNLDNYKIADKDRFIAGFNSRRITGTMQLESTNKFRDEPDIREYKIRTGRSLLANIVQDFQVLSALEDAMFINRLSKSTEFKVVTIDVGEGTNNKQAQAMINSVKNAIKSSEAIDLSSSRYTNRQSPVPKDDWIFIPTRGTKGSITVETFGGEVVEAKTADIDYYRNKVFAGLGVLKAYLGFEETTPGGLGDSTLSKLDERFGKRIIRLQSILKGIVNQMISFYWRYSTSSRKRTEDNLPEYEIILGKVSTKEEQEARETLKDSLDIADRLIGMLREEEFVDFVDKKKLFSYIFEEVIGIDTKEFIDTPSPGDIPLHTKNIDEKKNLNENTKLKTKVIEEMLRDPIAALPKKDLKELFDNYEIYVDTGGEVISLNEALKRTRYKRVYLEKTYKQLKTLSKSKDPARLAKSKRLTVKYTGIDKDNLITFRVTAEDPEANKRAGRPTSYKTKVSLKDLAYLLQAAREDEEKITDKDLILLAMQGDVDVSCTCPSSLYWGQQYLGTKQDYSLDKNTIEPTVRPPKIPVCKHTIATLSVLPFWYNTIIRDLRVKGVLGSSKIQDEKIEDQSEELKEETELEELEASEKALENK